MATQWEKLPFRFVTPGEVFSIGLVLPLVCIVLGGERLHVRHLQKQKLGIDDWLAILGIVMVTGMGVCLMVGERLGVMGYPTPVPSGTIATEAYGLFNKAYETEAKLEFAFQFLQCFEFGFIKASIVFFIRRIFSIRGTFIDRASIGLLCIIVLWSVSFLMALIFGCGKNVAIHWAPLQELVKSGCDGITPEKASLISDPILDFIILIFPIPAIWGLNMSTGRKWAVTGIFAVGIMSFAAALTRLAIHIVVLNQGYGAGYDINQTVTTIYYFSMLEGGLGAIVACLPTLSFLLRDSSWLDKLLRKGTNWSSLFRLRSWRLSRTQTNGEDGSSSGSRVVRPKWSDSRGLDDSEFYAMTMEHLRNHPTVESNRSQKELLTINLRPNDSPA